MKDQLIAFEFRFRIKNKALSFPKIKSGIFNKG